MKEKIIDVHDLIVKYFSGKTDKGGHSYSDHLYAVADKAKVIASIYGYDRNSLEVNKVYLIGLLHDILEDTECTEQELIDAGCTKEIIDIIKVVTRKPEDKFYFDFIKRVSQNELATIVKLADLEHNMDITRLSKFGEYEMKRLKKYWYSYKFLKDEITEEQAQKEIGTYK